MSWLFSQALVEVFSEDTSSDGEQFAPLNGNPTQQAYCAPDKMTDFSRLSQYGMTYKPLTESRGKELLTLFREDFRAKTSVPRGGGQGSLETNLQCGNTWQGVLAKLDPNTYLWKIPQCSLFEDLELSLQTWPRWGLMQDGVCWEQRTLEQTIRGTESGLLEQTFPTPVASDYKGGKSNTVHYKNQRFVRISNTTSTEFGAKLSAAYHLMTGNPLPENFSEWMMGWPLGWTDLKPLETDKFQRWQQLHGEF